MPETGETGEIRKIKEQYKNEILLKPNVVGVGVGYRVVGGRETDELSLVALVRRKLPLTSLAPHAQIPKEVDSVPVDVRQVGFVRAQQTRQERWRPAPGGVSIGHFQITAGTLGCVVRDRRSGVRLILSNNHVLANSNNASPGDPILQPGPYDGGSQDRDVIARLERFVKLQFTTAPGTCGIAQTVADFLNWLAGLAGSSTGWMYSSSSRRRRTRSTRPLPGRMTTTWYWMRSWRSVNRRERCPRCLEWLCGNQAARPG